MSRRSLVSIGAVVVALLVLVVWLLWPDTVAPEVGAQLRDAELAASVAPPPLPLPAERSDVRPVAAVAESAALVEPPLPADGTADFAPLSRSIDISVIRPSGEALRPWLSQELPELNRLVVVATLEPLECLPESIAPYYRCMGLGRFDSAGTGNAHRLPSTQGFIGTLFVPARAPVCVNLAIGPIVIAAQRPSPDADSVLFVVDPVDVKKLGGSARLQVVSAETRQPIEGASVQVGLRSLRRPDRPDCITDDLGLCELHDFTPGPTQLLVSAPGYEERGLDATIPRAETVDVGTVELDPATSVSGRVVFATGDPVSRPYVTAYLDDASMLSSSLAAPYATTKGHEGDFTLEGLGRRRYVLLVLASDPNDDSYTGLRKAMVRVDTTAGDVADLLITVEPASTVRFLNPPGHEGVSVHVRSEAAPFFDWWPDIPYLSCPDAVKVSLVPGRYVVEFGVPGQALQRRPLVVGSEPMDFDVSR